MKEISFIFHRRCFSKSVLISKLLLKQRDTVCRHFQILNPQSVCLQTRNPAPIRQQLYTVLPETVLTGYHLSA